MANVCVIAGKRAQTGHTVSHSNIKSNRSFRVNLQTKRYFVPETGKWITLKLSTSAMRTITKKGISAVIKEMADKHVKLK